MAVCVGKGRGGGGGEEGRGKGARKWLRFKLQSTLVSSTSLISNNRLSRCENLVPC